MDTELIIITELYKHSKIEPSFIELLESEGLLKLKIVEGKQYIEQTDLHNLERFARWYYDLSINIEGIDVIQNLLEQMTKMHQELCILRRKFSYQTDLLTKID